jgi:S-formylglutathione hydrolase FrmB
MEDVHFFSPALERHVIYRVFLPIFVAPGQQLRVVYLLHGNGGSYTNWSNYSDVAHYASQGLLLVMSDGASSYWVNADKPERDKYTDFLTRDLVADVEARFPVRRDRAGRTVVGVSMGGYGAVEYALARSDLYGFAGAISPALDVPSRKFSWRRWSQWARFRDIFGSPGSPERQARDPFVQVRSADPQSGSVYLHHRWRSGSSAEPDSPLCRAASCTWLCLRVSFETRRPRLERMERADSRML